jgi:bifunctional ADP-heptose synthase (sugar kinase/adenylyltransferase)
MIYFNSHRCLGQYFMLCCSSFEEDTPQQLVNLILPDILVKGGDYPTDNIVHAQEVVTNNGKGKIIVLSMGTPQ